MRFVLSCLIVSVAVLGCGSDSKNGFGQDASSADAADASAVDATPEAGDAAVSFGDSEAPDVKPVPLAPVDVIATADNAYAFGWGDATQVTTYIANPPSVVAGDIFNCPVGGPDRLGTPLTSGQTAGPERYVVPAADAPPTAYLYLVAWADFSTTQGVIAQFNREGGDVTYTGAGPWEACATGVPYDTGNSNTATGPTQSVVNQQIAICDLGSASAATTSAGWVDASGATTSTPNAVGKVVFGQDNSSTSDKRGTPGFDFPPTCGEPSWTDPDNGGIAPQARWMWYAPPNFSGDAFQADGTNFTRSFLIFRLPAKSLPNPN